MSNYMTQMRNKETGEIQEIACIDNYFRHHVYGFQPMENGKPTNDILIHQELYERFDDVLGTP